MTKFTRVLRWPDLVPVLLIAALAFVISVDVLNTRHDGMYPTGDTAIYSSHIASWLWPSFFSGDPFLGDRWVNGPLFAIVFFPLGMLFRVLFGDFLTAFSVMNFPIILAQGLGFYFLGKRLFSGRTRALLLVVATYMPAFGIFWNVQAYTLGRTWYMALFPFLLLACLRYGPDPRSWNWLMGAGGLSMHVHPVSAPGVGFAMLIGLAAFKPNGWSARFLLWRLFLGGLAFLAGALPFTITNFIMSERGPIADYDSYLQILIYSGYTFAGVGIFVGKMFEHGYIVVLVAGGLISAVVAWTMRAPDRAPVNFLIFWCFALVFATTAFPWSDYQMATWNEARPNLPEMVRGLRYLAPMAWIFMLLATFAVFDRMTPAAPVTRRALRPATATATAMAIVLVGLFGAGAKLPRTAPYIYAWYQFVPMLTTLSCWSKGRFLCANPGQDHLIPVIEHLKSTYPKGTRILPFVNYYPGVTVSQANLASIIRFTARLPVAFGFNERILIIYGDLSERGHIWRWLEWRNLYAEAFRRFQTNHPRPLPKLRALVDELDVDVIVTEFSLDERQRRALGRTTFRNDVLTVIDVRDSTLSP